MTIAVSFGERSGELLAELLQQEMERTVPGCRVARLRAPAALGPVLGFAAGLAKAHRLERTLEAAEKEVVGLHPDVLVLVSFAAFNLPLGRRCRKLGVPVLYLSPPQVWAWGRWRIPVLRAAADKVVCLFSFEEALLRSGGVDASYFGYPLLDSVRCNLSREQVLRRLGLEQERRYVVYMPGSRPAEVTHHRPLFRVVHALLSRDGHDLNGVMIAEPDGEEPHGMMATSEHRYDVMRHAEAALVVSGTATAECAILGTPMVVSYYLPLFSRFLARGLVRVPFFSLPNIIAGRRVVPEYLNPSAEQLAGSLAELTGNLQASTAMRRRLAQVRHELGPGGALPRIANAVAELARRRGPLP